MYILHTEPMRSGSGSGSDTGYPHDCHAVNAAYLHDGCADNAAYPHDRHI